MYSLMTELKTIHRNIEELEISEETARILYQSYIRSSSKDWELRSLARVEHEVAFDHRFAATSVAMMEYMEGSSFDYPLDGIIEIKWNLENRIRAELGFGNQFQFASKNGLITTLQQHQTRHLRYQVKLGL